MDFGWQQAWGEKVGKKLLLTTQAASAFEVEAQVGTSVVSQGDGVAFCM